MTEARGKAWFGVRDSFAAVDANWTILRETTCHMTALDGFVACSALSERF